MASSQDVSCATAIKQLVVATYAGWQMPWGGQKQHCKVLFCFQTGSHPMTDDPYTPPSADSDPPRRFRRALTPAEVVVGVLAILSLVQIVRAWTGPLLDP